MSWAGLGSNYLVSRADLQDAVNNGIFTMKAGQSIPTTPSTKCVSALEAETYCNLDARGGLGIPDNRCPQKSWLVANSYIVYPFYAWATNQMICDYQGFPSLAYRAASDTGPFYSDSALTTTSPNGWIRKDADKKLEWRIGSSGGIGQNVSMVNATLANTNMSTDPSGSWGAGRTSVYNNPRNTLFKITATILTSNNSGIGWYINVVTTTNSAVTTSATNSNSSVGQTNEVTFQNNTCDTIEFSISPAITPPTQSSLMTFAITFTLA